MLSKIQTFYQLAIWVFLICDISIIKTKDQTILNDWWLQLMCFISCNLTALQEICSPWLLCSFCLNLHNSSPGNFGDRWYGCADYPFFADNCNVHRISHGAPNVLRLNGSRIHFYDCLLHQNCIANLFFASIFIVDYFTIDIIINKLFWFWKPNVSYSRWAYDYPFHCHKTPLKIWCSLWVSMHPFCIFHFFCQF